MNEQIKELEKQLDEKATEMQNHKICSVAYQKLLNECNDIEARICQIESEGM